MTGQIASLPGLSHASDFNGQTSVDDMRTAIQITPTWTENSQSITIQVCTTDAFFRIQPVRDPRQPSIWCVSVRQCSSGGIVDEAGQCWVDRPGMERANLGETIAAIRADVGGWLAAPNRQPLCRWVLTAEPLPTAAQLAGLSEASTSTRRTR